LRSMWWVVRASSRELNTARCEKVANAIEARFPIDMPVVVGGYVKGMKRFSFLRGTLPKVIVEHLFPTCRVKIGRISYHAIEIKENGIVAITDNCPCALGLRCRSRRHGLKPLSDFIAASPIHSAL